MYNGDLEGGMVEQRATLDITRSNQYRVQAPVHKVTSHLIQPAMVNIAELYALHRIDSNAEHFAFIDCHLADNKYHCPVAEHVEGGVRRLYPTQRESRAAHE